jgi:hypothetical protein
MQENLRITRDNNNFRFGIGEFPVTDNGGGHDTFTKSALDVE